MNSPTDLEIEVKFFLAQADLVRNRILAFNPILKGRVFERNIRFDDEDASLLKQGRLLRLREDEKVRLTYKAPAEKPSAQAKVRQELEVEVNQFATMRRIIHGLGFFREQAYEKYRETFVLHDLELCIDAMPFGDFLEIEGPSEAKIAEFAADIGMIWEQRILTSYLGIFSLIKKSAKLPFHDLTFENFQALHIRMEDYLPQLTYKNSCAMERSGTSV